MGRRNNSSGSPPWALARKRQPQFAPSKMASASSICVISSTAIHWGFMLRRRNAMLSRLFAPDSTSHAPTSNLDAPSQQEAISYRSSAMETRNFRERFRTRSRSSVVFPPPGGDTINTDPRPSFSSSSSEIPRHSFPTRIFSDEIFRIEEISPSR